MELSKLNKLITKVGKGAATLKADIQAALVGVAYFAQRDRNVDPAKRLFAAVGNEANRKAISHWLSINAPVYFKNEIPTLSDKHQKEFQGTIEEFLAALEKAAPWYEHAGKANKAENIWDGLAVGRATADYLSKQGKRARKEEDTLLANLLAEVEMHLRSKLNEVEYDEVEPS